MADAEEEFLMSIEPLKDADLWELAATMGSYKAKHIQSAISLGKHLTIVLKTEHLRSTGGLVSVCIIDWACKKSIY